MLRAKTGKEPPKAEPISVDPADEPPPPPRRRRPNPPQAAASPGDGGLDPARPLVDTGEATQPPPAPSEQPPVARAPQAEEPPAASPAPQAAPRPAPAQAPAGPSEPSAPEESAAPAGAASPATSEAEQLNAAMGDVIGRLKPVTKALFVGRFDDAGSGLEFHLDNPAILDRALARQGEFGEAVSAAVGRPVNFKLVAGAGTGAAGVAGRDTSGRHGRSAHDGGPAPRGGDDADDAEWADNSEFDGLVVDDLEDADPPLSAAQRLLEAFPGAELIEPEGT